MINRNWQKCMFPFVLAAFIVAGTLSNTFGHGGGGGGGGDGGADNLDSFGSDLVLTDKISTLTEDQIKNIFSCFSDDFRDQLAEYFTVTYYEQFLNQGEASTENIFVFPDIENMQHYVLTIRDLYEIRQAILSGNSNWQQTVAYLTDISATTVETIDKAGQVSELGLAFVPGVGWVTQATIGGLRAGAEANKNSKDNNEILKDALVGIFSSVAINKLSPFELDEIYDLAKSSKNLKEALPLISKYLIGKKVEGYAGEAIAGSGVPNRTPPPRHTTSMGSEFDQMGQRTLMQ